MESPLDLSITLTLPPQGSPPEVVAAFDVHCDQLGLSHAGNVLFDPLTSQERENLRWYLEEYAEWPYEQFLERARQIEASLPELGKRLYRAVFGSAEAMNLVQTWRLYPLPAEGQRQISIISEVPRALSLPWELLHDEQGFLVLCTRQPVSLIRRLPQRELAASPNSFEPPLRILLVTARPAHTGFVDPRSIARELLDELQPQIDAGSIALEFLRPPTLPALRARLSDPTKPPIHVLHFDGHGLFDTKQGEGLLAFEDDSGRLDRIKAEMVAKVLQDSGVRLAVLTACQSALSSTDDAFSSVAARLIGSGVDAVVAMSASVLVTSATRYAEAFYRALAASAATAVAQERARQALHDDPRRHLHRRRPDEEGTVVLLRDWWVSHYYQQRPVSLEPIRPSRKRKPTASPILPRLSSEFPSEPRYGFSGRARELLQVERALLQKKLVAIAGFGGIGKTALAREVADWLTRTRMYDGACFVSFEHGGDAAMLLSILGNYLGINGVNYYPHEPATALIRLNSVFKGKKVLLVADNLESILPRGEVPLEPAERAALWDVLLKLHEMGVGLLLTSRDRNFGDGRLEPGKWTKQLLLRGLAPQDAYALASRLLTDLGIDRSRVPYAELRDLLAQLDHHPLAIQLVLPVLRDLPLATIRTDFATHLSRFIDDTETGRNRSLLASLDYSLRRLSEEQRILLARLAVFEVGAVEAALLAITQISDSEWLTLRQGLEQAALLTVEHVHEDVLTSFLHFHPVLVPFLRGLSNSDDMVLLERYIRHYNAYANYLYRNDNSSPQPVRAFVKRELPNFLRALTLLLKTGDLGAASDMTKIITMFLDIFGLNRLRDELWRQLSEVVKAKGAQKSEILTLQEYSYESGLGEEEYRKGDLQAACNRFTALLARFEASPEDTQMGHGSFNHCMTLSRLARCLRTAGHPAACDRLREALSIIDTLIQQEPDDQNYIRQRGMLQAEMGDTLLAQGQYLQAQRAYEEALEVAKRQESLRPQVIVLTQLGLLALKQREYAEARARYMMALDLSEVLGEPALQATEWHQLGRIAQEQEELSEAERCFRKSLALNERLGNVAEAVMNCNELAFVAEKADRPTEAEGWYKRAMRLNEQIVPGSLAQARNLNNLTALLKNEVRSGRHPRTRLTEARDYAEQALEIMERLDASAGIWTTLSVLADIADLEGQPEVAQNYRHRERECFAAFAGNRYLIDQQFRSFIGTTAAASTGDARARATVEALLPELEQRGWCITSSVRRIWMGERDWHALVDGMDHNSALLVLRVLETVAESPETPSSGVERWQATDDGGAEKAGV